MWLFIHKMLGIVKLTVTVGRVANSGSRQLSMCVYLSLHCCTKYSISLSRMLSKILFSILQITKRLLMISPAKLKVKLVFLTWQASLDDMQCFSG